VAAILESGWKDGSPNTNNFRNINNIANVLKNRQITKVINDHFDGCGMYGNGS
jgi:hypothetical protein